MNLEIDYQSEGFAAGAPVANSRGVLRTSWDELLWAAITVGRPNRHYVFRHGRSSGYEALFRWSLVRMALEQSGPRASRLRRTSAARTLDPSEKGAINYFLGLTICKLFADRLLGAPWMLHLDVFRPMLNPVLTGRSRPDLVGERTAGGWIALECKGRATALSNEAKDKAKQQAQRLVSVNGVTPAFHIGGAMFFRNDVLQFYWRDPEPDPNVKNPIVVKVEPDLWRHHYTPVLDLIRSDPNALEQMQREPALMRVESADIEIGIRPDVLSALVAAQWEKARALAQHDEYRSNNFQYKTDGIAVVAGESWLKPFEEAEGRDG